MNRAMSISIRPRLTIMFQHLARRCFAASWALMSLLGGPAAARAGYMDVILADNPIGYWRMGDAPGSMTAVDSSGNGLHGTYNGGFTLGNPGALVGDLDTSTEFHSDSGYVDAGAHSTLNQLTNDFTIEAWVLGDDGGRIASTRSNGGGYGFGPNATRLLFTTFEIQDYVLPVSRDTTVWSHVAVVFDSSNDATFYLNGENVGTVTGTQPARANSETFNIGRSPIGNRDGDFGYLDGGIDEVAIYDRVLLPDELQEHYRAGVTPPVAAAIRLESTGDSYMQDFDANLGAGDTSGLSLPLGWVANVDGDVNNAVTDPFPPAIVAFGTYNAGAGADRALATGNTDSTRQNNLQLSAQLVGGNEVRAVRLAFDVEAWAGNLNADNPGEAAYLVDLDVDRTGNGDFGRILAFNDGAKITTGPSLTPGLLDGNSDANFAMFDSGLIELQEAIPAGSDIRLTFDAQNVGRTEGYIFGLDDVLFRIVAPGDTDGNGVVDSDDLFNMLEAGKFNHSELGPASWAEGDYNGDDLVNSDDLFLIRNYSRSRLRWAV